MEGELTIVASHGFLSQYIEMPPAIVASHTYTRAQK